MSAKNPDVVQAKVQFWLFAAVSVLMVGLAIVDAIQHNVAGALALGLVAVYCAWRASGGRTKLKIASADVSSAPRTSGSSGGATATDTEAPTDNSRLKSAMARLLIWAALAVIAMGLTAFFAFQENGWAAAGGGIAMLVVAQRLRAASKDMIDAGRPREVS